MQPPASPWPTRLRPEMARGYAMPHERLGETPCAYVVLRAGQHLTQEDMAACLEEARLARQKFPERLFVLPDLPRTASGKVLKTVLRKRVADDLAGPAR